MRSQPLFIRDYSFLGALILSAVAVCALAHKSFAKITSDEPKYDRAENIIINLNKAQGCAGWWILQDIHKVQEMDHDLGKAHFQVEEADKTYAKLRGRKDDKFLSLVTLKIEKVEQDRRILEEDLHDAFDQLRTTIKDVIMTDPELKLRKGK
jgi:hypothetical protein